MYNEDLIFRVNELLKKKGVSQKKAAAEMNLSAAALSLYLRKNYENGNIEATEIKIKEWISNTEASTKSAEQMALKPIKHEYLPTTISTDVYKRIQYCQIEKGMVILHGDAGIGKTKAAAKYVNDHPNTCIYIQASPSISGMKEIIRYIAETLNVPIQANRYLLSVRIKQRLIETDKTLIIDEAQHLRIRTLEELRCISDADDIRKLPGTGIVLIGNTEVYNRMMGKQSATFAQLFSRIKMHRYYSTNDIQKKDISQLFTYLYEEKMQRELDFLTNTAKSKWGIRGAVNVYNNAVNNEDVSYKGLYIAARELGIGVI